MINFSDEWTVQAVAKSRQARFHDEARHYRLIQEAGRNRLPSSSLRQSVGLKMVRLGEQILGTGV